MFAWGCRDRGRGDAGRGADVIIQTDKPLRKRDANDFYPTPIEVCRAALSLVEISYFVPYAQYAVLDPGAGTGVWGKAAKERWSDCEVGGCDIRDIPQPDAYDHWLPKFDFLQLKAGVYDLVIGNPPYKFAERFVRHALKLTAPKGYVVFLLPLRFLEGQNRGVGLWRDFPPKSVHVMSARPSFIDSGPKAGNTDNTAYAIYIWQKGWTGQPTLGWFNWKADEKANQPALFEVS